MIGPGEIAFTRMPSVAHFAGETIGKTIHAALRCGIPDEFRRRPIQGSARRDQHDCAALPAEARGHAPDRLARAQDGAAQIDREHFIDGGGGGIGQWRMRAGDAPVVYQHRKLAQAVHFREYALDVGLDASVRLHCNSLAAHRMDLLHHRLRALAIVRVGQHHIEALARSGH